VFPNAKTAGNGDTQLSHAEYKVPSASNAMAPTNPNIIGNSVGVTRQMPKLTHLD